MDSTGVCMLMVAGKKQSHWASTRTVHYQREKEIAWPLKTRFLPPVHSLAEEDQAPRANVTGLPSYKNSWLVCVCACLLPFFRTLWSEFRVRRFVRSAFLGMTWWGRDGAAVCNGCSRVTQPFSAKWDLVGVPPAFNSSLSHRHCVISRYTTLSFSDNVCIKYSISPYLKAVNLSFRKLIWCYILYSLGI